MNFALLLHWKDLLRVLKAIQQTFEVRNTPLENTFYRSATEFDLTILRHAWTSVQLLSTTETFEKNWELLLDCLKPLDEIMEG